MNNCEIVAALVSAMNEGKTLTLRKEEDVYLIKETSGISWCAGSTLNNAMDVWQAGTRSAKIAG